MLKTQKLQGDLFGQQSRPPNYPNGPVQGLHRGNAGFLFHEIHHRCVVTRTQDDFGLGLFPRKRTNVPMKNAGTGTFPFEMVPFSGDMEKKSGVTL